MEKNNQNHDLEQRNSNIVIDMDFLPILRESTDLTNHKKLPIKKLTNLGLSISPILNQLNSLQKNTDYQTEPLYRAIKPAGTHLAPLKDDPSKVIGSLLYDHNNSVAYKQARFEAVPSQIQSRAPLSNALTLAIIIENISQKLDSIQQISQDALDFLIEDKYAILESNYELLSSIILRYKLNWKNDTFVNASYSQVQTIKKESNQNAKLFKQQLHKKINRISSPHTDEAVEKKRKELQPLFEAYKLAFISYVTALFTETILIKNFNEDYLSIIRNEIIRANHQCEDTCNLLNNKVKAYYNNSIQSAFYNGTSYVIEKTGQACNIIPNKNEDKLGNKLIEKSNQMKKTRNENTIKKANSSFQIDLALSNIYINCIDEISDLCSNNVDILVDNNYIYINKKDR